jgi:hypothetical protein
MIETIQSRPRARTSDPGGPLRAPFCQRVRNTRHTPKTIVFIISCSVFLGAVAILSASGSADAVLDVDRETDGAPTLGVF